MTKIRDLVVQPRSNFFVPHTLSSSLPLPLSGSGFVSQPSSSVSAVRRLQLPHHRETNFGPEDDMRTTHVQIQDVVDAVAQTSKEVFFGRPEINRKVEQDLIDDQAVLNTLSPAYSLKLRSDISNFFAEAMNFFKKEQVHLSLMRNLRVTTFLSVSTCALGQYVGNKLITGIGLAASMMSVFVLAINHLTRNFKRHTEQEAVLFSAGVCVEQVQRDRTPPSLSTSTNVKLLLPS